MAPPTRFFDFDWKRISRWCLLGTIVMLLWLLAPVARCSYAAFRDTPISQVDENTARPADSDRARVEEGQSFFHSLATSVKACYLRTPLMGQESWKRGLLLGFAGAMVVAGILNRIESRRGRTML